MDEVKKEVTTVDRKIRNYDEGSVIADLGKAGTKIKIITSTEAIEIGSAYGLDPLVLVGKKIIEISKKNPLGIKRLGKVDFLLNSCKGYVGVVMSKK